MGWLALPGVLAVVAAAVVAGRALRIRRRHAAVAADAAQPAGDGERLIDAPRALYHGTRFADGTAFLPAAWAAACVADLWCTEAGLFLRREEGGPAPGSVLAIPLDRVEDSLLLRAHAPLAGKALPMLRLRWRRGGELLETSLSLPGGMASLERLRREVHLRQSKGDLRTRLAPLLTREPTPGAGHLP